MWVWVVVVVSRYDPKGLQSRPAWHLAARAGQLLLTAGVAPTRPTQVRRTGSAPNGSGSEVDLYTNGG
jgi:hypothetical protein